MRDLKKKKKKKYLRGDGGKVPGIRGVFRQNSFRRAFGDGDEGVDERHALCVCVYYQRACGNIWCTNGDSKGTFSLKMTTRGVSLFSETLSLRASLFSLFSIITRFTMMTMTNDFCTP